MRRRPQIVGMVAAISMAALFGCKNIEDHLKKQDLTDYHDPYGKMQRDDYKDLAPKQQSASEKDEGVAPVPKVSQILVAPRPEKESDQQLVSIAVTQDVPLKDVFVELARLANVDLEIDPNVTGGIIFRAKDRPLQEVIQRICEMAGLRYRFDNDVLRISMDTPMLQNYALDFLNISRTNQGGVNVSTNVLSAGDGGSSSVTTGSNASVSTSSETDLWQSFETAIQQIVQAANVAQAAAGSASSNYYVINKEAGMLSVFSSETVQARVKDFVETLNKKATAQVQIEAKIVEVTLNEEFRSGIDWSSFSFSKPLNFDFDVRGTDTANGAFTFRARNDATNNLQAVVNLTENFGTARTLSSPRISAINNQQAVLTFAENEVYFEINVDRETSTTGSSNQQLFTVDSTVKTVPIGIIVVVQPSINPITSEITLNVRPTLSRVVSRVEDPAVAFLAAQAGGQLGDIQNLIPVVEVRELDTVMKIHSGDILVMGGLMEERISNTEGGVPVLSSIPWVGKAFKDIERKKDVVEMVILMKATIIPSTGIVSPQDIKTYRKFSSDPRPFTF